MALATVAPDDQVESENHNSIVGLLNGTPGFGQPTKLYDYSDTATYSLTVGNQDTTNGLIAKFQYGPVGAATEVVRITKAGIYGVIHDLGQTTFELEGFAAVGANIRGTSPSEDPDAAWTAAFAAVQAAGGGTILLGPYTYLAPTSAVTWVANCILRGAGMYATTIYHRNSSAREPVRFLNLAGCGVIDLAVNGNYSNNKTFASAEITVDGDHSFAHRVRVYNHNYWAIECGGLDTSVSECHIVANAPNSYTPWSLTNLDENGLWGVVTASTQVCKRIRILGNTITGHRSGAIVGGGIGCVIANNTVEDNHRSDLGFSAGTPGGQIALVFTKTTATGDTQPQHCVVANNAVGPMPSAVGGVGGAIGIECNSWKNCLVIGNTVNNVSEIGISFSASGAASSGCQIIGNTVHSVDTHDATVAGGGSIGVTVDANGYNISGLLIEGMVVSNCRNVLSTAESGGGVVTGLSMKNWTLIANTAGWTNNMATSVYKSGGHVYLSTFHAPLPEYNYHNYATGNINAYETYSGVFINTGSGSNSSNTANGLLVISGAIATDHPLRVATTGAVDRLTVRGNGDVVLGTAALATNATGGGWLWIASCAGTPTGVPATLYTGRVPLHYDSTNHKLYVYDSGWKATAALT